jgi:hypothetical protein
MWQHTIVSSDVSGFEQTRQIAACYRCQVVLKRFFG